uniref:Uncharacterized protein n=1 Tax=Arundo donax TaxID=35708 RepID=A0A0A9GYG5_ARUDO
MANWQLLIERNATTTSRVSYPTMKQ